jgi:hypothetical protein
LAEEEEELRVGRELESLEIIVVRRGFVLRSEKDAP